MHPTLEKVDVLYRSLREDVQTLADRHVEAKAEVDKLSEELNNLKAATREEAMKIEQSRNELDQEKNEFEAFRTEALQQMETYREELETNVDREAANQCKKIDGGRAKLMELIRAQSPRDVESLK